MFSRLLVDHLETGNKVLQRGIESPDLTIVEGDVLLGQDDKGSTEEQLRVGRDCKVGLGHQPTGADTN